MRAQENILLLVLLTLSLLPADVKGHLNIYYVKADNSSCSHDPCKTLTEYAQNDSAFFTSHTQLVFLPGLHALKVNTSVHIENVSQLSLIGNESLPNSTAGTLSSPGECIIQCEDKAGFEFVNTSII